ncbi:MAG: hypothetical protein JNK79_06850 [Chitinophagaceae bacterium]|nr:hypothetical protein [Chitinophagaceae bacterium]
MRLLAFILSIIVLGMSSMPCNDDLDTSGVVKDGYAASQGETQQHREACSPFCHCSCCASFSFVGNVPAVKIPQSYHPGIASIYNAGAVIEISLPVWQPPQLV